MNKQQFWKGISILVNNYHAINRKLFACEIINAESVFKGLEQLKNGTNSLSNKQEIEKNYLKLYLQKTINNGDREHEIEGFIIHFKCIPKKNGESWRATGIIGRSPNKHTGITLIYSFFFFEILLILLLECSSKIIQSMILKFSF